MKKKIYYFFFTLLLCSAAYSQAATDSLFYPYQKGNVLRYYYPNTRYKYITQSVIKDTLFENGKRYSAILVQYGNSPDEIDYYDSVYFRSDATTGNVYKFYSGAESLEDSVNSKPGNFFGKKIFCSEIKNDSVFNHTATIKLYHQKISYDSFFTVVSYPFGRIYSEQMRYDTIKKIYYPLSPIEKLIYAKIGNKIYGSLLLPEQKDSLQQFYTYHIGNAWIYEYINGISGYHTSKSVRTRTVIGDTIINNKFYVRVHETISKSDKNRLLLFRYDSIHGVISQWNGNLEILVDSLSCTNGTKGSMYAMPKYTFKSESTYSFGRKRPIRKISMGHIETVYYRTTAWNIGDIEFGSDNFMGEFERCRLIYAKVNGKEYGKKELIDSLSRYHPIHTGNTWIYKRNSNSSPSYYDNMFISREVVGDTLFENKQYQKILEKNSKDGSSKLTVERFDSSNGNFYQGFPNTVPGMNVEFSLADSTAAGILNTSFRSGKLIELSPDTVFHQLSLTRSILTLLTIDVTIVKKYSYGFGMVREEHSVMESYYDSIVYARINGTEYGSKPLFVDKDHNVIPASYSLSQNFPNPFNPLTTISYQIPVQGMVSLKVYSILGTEIATLVHQQQSAGSYSLNFNASFLASGVYFYRFQAGRYHNTRKMILTK